jgi:hypothetical protein
MSATRSKLFEFSDVAVTPLGLVIFSSVDVLVHIANGLIKQSREFVPLAKRCYRPNHVLLICSAANGNPADTNLIRKEWRDRHFCHRSSQDAN